MGNLDKVTSDMVSRVVLCTVWLAFTVHKATFEHRSLTVAGESRDGGRSPTDRVVNWRDEGF